MNEDYSSLIVWGAASFIWLIGSLFYTIRAFKEQDKENATWGILAMIFCPAGAFVVALAIVPLGVLLIFEGVHWLVGRFIKT
jgi:hypothetical protein